MSKRIEVALGHRVSIGIALAIAILVVVGPGLYVFGMTALEHKSPSAARHTISIQINPGACNWFDLFGGEELFVVVYSSRTPQERKLIPANGPPSVIDVVCNPGGSPDDEYVIELWDDDGLDEATAKHIAEISRAGGRLLLTCAASKKLNATSLYLIRSDIDALASELGSINFEKWERVAHATMTVGNAELPTRRYANAVALLGDDNRSYGDVRMFREEQVSESDVPGLSGFVASYASGGIPKGEAQR